MIVRCSRVLAAWLALAGVVAGCSPTRSADEVAPAPRSEPVTAQTAAPADRTAAPSPATTEVATPRSRTAAVAPPPWLGRRVLPRRPDGFGVVRRTPPILRDRRFATRDVLPPPADGRFAATVSRVTDDVIARSTWAPDCPVGRPELRYLTVTFWGFDDQAHTGELLVHRSVARDLVGVFRRLFRARYPIEEMRVVRADELDLPPTGDGNNTTAFVCRPSRQATSWSRHAYGLAIDVNPFHNPYVKGDLVLPELASAYADRDRRRPGMIQPGGEVVAAFDDIGWGWGGHWRSLKDWMHFSDDGT